MKRNCHSLKSSILVLFSLFGTNQLFAQQHTITNFSPKTALKGQSITITGTNFSNITGVNFGGTAATSFTVNSSTSISAIVASGSSGSISISKSGFNNVSKSGFVFTDSVNQLITDYNGYWLSNSGSNNSTFPDNNHNLLAFKSGNIVYSTGVNDPILTNNSIIYTAGDWKALPINNLGGSNTKAVILYATYADGSLSCINPNKTIIDVLIDGTKGLNIGTGVANFDAQMEFTVSSINTNKISDNVPDILITQVAEPTSNLADIYWFTNSSGTIVGDSVSAIVSFLPVLGTYRLDVHNLTNSSTSNNNAITNGCSSSSTTNSTRTIRLLSLKLSDFGINSSNASNVAFLKFKPSGIADYAFVAYNGESFIIPAPTVTSQPTSKLICASAGNSVTFSVTVSSATTPSYQWKKNGTDISGATSSSYTINNVTASDAATYVCEITNTAGTVLSDPAYLNTYIAIQPESKSTCINVATSLSISAVGNSPVYQWYSNTSNSNIGGTLISGATSNTYTPAVNISGTFYYYCVVAPAAATSTCSTAIASTVATLVVSPSTVGGSTINSASVCLPTNSTSLAVVGYTGSIIRWESASNTTFTSPTSITNTTTSYTANNIQTTTYYRATVQSGTCASANSNYATITPITTYTWTGSTSNQFSNSQNWQLGCVPPSGSNISFAASPSNPCKLNANTNLGTITINGSSSNHVLDLNGYSLTVQGSLSLTNGKINAESTNSNLILQGSSTQNIPSNALINNNIQNLTINNSSGVAIQGPINLIGLLTFTNGTLTTNNNLTLKSTAQNTAMVGPINYSNAINGNVTVEKFSTGKRAFRLISPSVSTTTTIRDNWQEGSNNLDTTNFSINNKNPNPGFGTHITGSKNGSNGFDATQTGNPSLFTFNNSTGLWSAINNTNANTLNAGIPYRLMIRGDRSINIHQPDNFPTPTNTVLRATGILTTSTVTVTGLNSTASASNFIGNPYQCAVDMSAILNNSTNLNKNYYYAWDPEVNTRGAYVAVNLSNGTNSMGSSATKYLQPQQACFVLTSTTPSGSPTLSFRESDKYTSVLNTDNFKFSSSDSNSLIIKLIESNAYITTDATQLYFSENQSNNIDDFDALKLINQDEIFASKENNRNFAIQYRSSPQNNEIIKLFIAKMRSVNYQIQMSVTGMSNYDIYLVDNYLNSITSLNQPYKFSINNSDSKSIDSNRFELKFQLKPINQLYLPNLIDNKFIIFPNPTSSNSISLTNLSNHRIINLSISNNIGQTVITNSSQINNSDVLINLTNLKSGLYYLRLLLDNNITIVKPFLISE